MSLPQREIVYTPEEYLEIERASDVRHEYLDGVIYEMAGESLAHSQLCINLAREISSALRGTPCQALSPNMKVRTGDHRLFSYPDLSVVCDTPLFHDTQQDVLLNTVAIFEVLSSSTEDYERSAKFVPYRTFIPTLYDYVLISQEAPVVEHNARQANGDWLLKIIEGMDATLRLSSLNCHVALRDLYERVEFVPPQPKKRRNRNLKLKKET